MRKLPFYAYDKLYSLGGKFQDVESCKSCPGCGAPETDVWVYLYPGELEYRRKRNLFPVFELYREERGERLYLCPLGRPRVTHLCLASPLVCKMSPIQVIKRGRRPAVVEFCHECQMTHFERDWVVAMTKIVVELYVNQGGRHGR